jgi:hypothetical protein
MLFVHAIFRITKSIGMSIAWYIQTVRSAFASALIGGLMMARATYQFLVHRNMTLGGLIKENHDDSVVDEGKRSRSYLLLFP